MKFHPAISFLVFAFLIVSPDQTRACGNHHSAKAVQADRYESVEISRLVSPPKNASGNTENPDSCCGKDHSGSDCPCGHENGGCRCPAGGAFCHSGANNLAEVSTPPSCCLSNTSVQKMAFYFAGHMPEAVYFPIWHPPRIVA